MTEHRLSFRERWRQLTGRATEPEPVTPVAASDGPPELPGGQDDGPPNLLLAVIVAAQLIDDMRPYVPVELKDRGRAVLAVLARIRRQLEAEQ